MAASTQRGFRGRFRSRPTLTSASPDSTIASTSHGAPSYISLIRSSTRRLPIRSISIPRSPRASCWSAHRRCRFIRTSSLPERRGSSRPNLTYDFRFGFNQQGFNFARQIPQNILPSAGYPIQLAYGVSGVKYLDAPGNDSINTLPKEGATVKEWQFNNSLNWVKASHLITGGFNYIHSNQYHYRLTQGGSIASPVAQITSGSYTQIPASQRPPTCSASLTTHCLPTGVLAEWNELYASLLGQWDYTSFLQQQRRQGKCGEFSHQPAIVRSNLRAFRVHGF